MARFLTDEWIAQMDAAAASPNGPRVADGVLVIQHVITDSPHETGPAAYHLVITPSEASVRQGQSHEATVTFTTSYPVASAIASGTTNAQAEFMAGNLRVGGSVAELTANQGALAAAEDVFAAVRATTEY